MSRLKLKQALSFAPERSLRGALSGLLAAMLLAVAPVGARAAAPETAAAQPVRGGALTVGVAGGSEKDTLDAHRPITHPDEARVLQLFDRLLEMDPDQRVQPSLASSVTSNADATTWTVTLREGIQFSDGRPITLDDVIASFLRMSDPQHPTTGTVPLRYLQRDAFVKVDEHTLEFHFSKPVVDFEEMVSNYFFGIVPADYDPAKPVSSGPYMLKSFVPGQQSTFVRNPHYWRAGQPYLDSVTIVDFQDDTARVNALLSNQVDAIEAVPLGQVRIVQANPQMRVLESHTAGFVPFTMRVDKEPFTDPRVRQAFRLIVNRKQMVAQVLAGRGDIGNDLFSRYDACFAKDIPQRTQDIAKARQLLKEAGKENLEVELVTSPVGAGFVEAAQVFAQQAKAAGVTVHVNRVDPGVFYGDQYLKWTFAQDFYYTHGYINQIQQSSLPDAPYNETHWNDPEWVSLVGEAMQTADAEKRCQLIQQAQKIEHERGSFIVWGFPNALDAYNKKVHGLQPDKSGIGLTSFRLRQVWLAQ